MDRHNWIAVVVVLVLLGLSCSSSEPSSVDAPKYVYDSGTDWWLGPCTIDECYVDEEKKLAGCAYYERGVSPPPGYRVCCADSVALIVVYACNLTLERCYWFATECIPWDWGPGPSCTLADCQVDEAKGEACCFTAGTEPPGFRPCCMYQEKPGPKTYACNRKETECYFFCNRCLPANWHTRSPKPDAGMSDAGQGG